LIAFYNIDGAVSTACTVDEINAVFFLILIVSGGSTLYPLCMEDYRLDKKSWIQWSHWAGSMQTLFSETI
jgi:hypothetical protein